ncbi:2-phospho-L-lactate guanylyltransferase [Microbacterium elymi]|uniref:2-phospho-L-lactate guanylyltransferase n=1 Tax=Microbacterium elymi TaxID=2909587 RepID=A0ABY5NH66_9MICO|nr:2-phospho-L-lactate guanylyltransferase [Microbacterium elymi]UUT34520.1 2-phospho-L-lactate guanylyltransferase [Microbacterium elymi]
MHDNTERTPEFCTGWTVVIPVKHAAHGKSRLSAAGRDRAALARAIALDTIAAACGVCAVWVVTDDADIGAAARALGATVVPEGERRGLNAAIAAGITAAAAALPNAHRAALLGDLPALRGTDLAAALRAAASVDRAVVPDAEATGSTLVTARAGVAWESAFGEGSLARHVALGCVVMDAAASLRRDIDTVDQLESAAGLGLGPRTATVFTGRRDAAEL